MGQTCGYLVLSHHCGRGWLMSVVATEVHCWDLFPENYAGNLVDRQPQLCLLGIRFLPVAPRPHRMGYEDQPFLPDSRLLQPATFVWGVPINLMGVFSEPCCSSDLSNPTILLLFYSTGSKLHWYVKAPPSHPIPSSFIHLKYFPASSSCTSNSILVSALQRTWSDIESELIFDVVGTSSGNLESSALEELLDVCKGDVMQCSWQHGFKYRIVPNLNVHP